MVTVAAARSILRSATTVRSAAAKAASASKSARSPFRIPTATATTPRIFRCPVELSACLDTLQPFHSASASALMTSMLSMSRGGFGWVPEGI
ncbi:hypothetical protein Droror1_Dr00003974 [Drosera rotundifolia]